MSIYRYIHSIPSVYILYEVQRRLCTKYYDTVHMIKCAAGRRASSSDSGEPQHLCNNCQLKLVTTYHIQLVHHLLRVFYLLANLLMFFVFGIVLPAVPSGNCSSSLALFFVFGIVLRLWHCSSCGTFIESSSLLSFLSPFFLFSICIFSFSHSFSLNLCVRMCVCVSLTFFP